MTNAPLTDLPLEHPSYNSRLDFLDEAKRLTTQDRNRQYGDFDHNMDVQALLWTIYLQERGLLERHKEISGSDASYLMGLSKYMRIMCGKLHPDNTQDEINYAAEGGWLAIRDHRQKQLAEARTRTVLDANLNDLKDELLEEMRAIREGRDLGDSIIDDLRVASVTDPKLVQRIKKAIAEMERSKAKPQ